MTSRTGGGHTWTTKWAGFDAPRWLADSGPSGVNGSEFHYNAARSRVMRLDFNAMSGGVPSQYTLKRLYAWGSTGEIDYTPGAVPQSWTLSKIRIYVPGPDGGIGAMEFMPSAPFSQAASALVYHYDQRGSIQAITPYGSTASTLKLDGTGKPASYAYDPWGQRRDPTGSTWMGPPATTDTGGATSATPRGYTGHEMLDNLGLVHMNGRIYDPLLGRFLSADLVVQAPGDLQSFNRYSYVMNNPLSGTDPSGFYWFKDDPMHSVYFIGSSDSDQIRTVTTGLQDTVNKEAPTVTAKQADAAAKQGQAEAKAKGLEPGTKTAIPIVKDGDVVGVVETTVEQTASAAVSVGASTAAAKGESPASAPNSKQSFGDPDPSYNNGGISFVTTLSSQVVPGDQAVPAPFGRGTFTLASQDAGASFIVGAPNVTVTGGNSSTLAPFMITGVHVSLPTIVYFNSTDTRFSNGRSPLSYQWAENQHAIDFWKARDSMIIPMLQDRIEHPFYGGQRGAAEELRREILDILYETNHETKARYDYKGGPHDGGLNPLPDGYPGFP